jgi:hypothetical protein
MAAGILLSSMSLLQAQNMISAGTPDIKIASASDVENTGLFLNHCASCNKGVAAAICWDGAEPGVAFTDDILTTVFNLPQGAHDPDIILGQGSYDARVVFELGNDILQIDFVLNPITLAIVSHTQTVVIENAIHPNIDLNGERIAFICQSTINLGPNNERLPIFTGTFGSPMAQLEDNSAQLVYAEDFTLGTNTDPCVQPDIAIGADNSSVFYIYPTFNEASPSGHLWFSGNLEVNVSGIAIFNFPMNTWHHQCTGECPPRIAAPTAGVFATNYVTAKGFNNSAAQQVWTYFGQSGATNLVDWLNTNGQSTYNPAIDWISDPYVNIAYTVDDASFTDKKDIIVAQRDHMGVAYFPGDWSRANMDVGFNQSIVSISGIDVQVEYNALFGYAWVNEGDNTIRYKSNEPTEQNLKGKSTKIAAFKVFPNPTTDFINILAPEAEKIQHVEIIDAQGKAVLTEKHTSVESYMLSVQSWPKGVYWMRINQQHIHSFILE